MLHFIDFSSLTLLNKVELYILIVSGDLSPLFELDFNGYSIAAVQDKYG